MGLFDNLFKSNEPMAQVIRTNEQKIAEEKMQKARRKCPLCGGEGRATTRDYEYNYYTCKECNCDYKVKKLY